MATVAILGSGGHGQDLASVAEAMNVDTEFFDDLLPGMRRCTPSCIRSRLYVVGVNDPSQRRAMVGRFVGLHAAALLHPSATPVALTEGCVVGPATQIGPDVHLGAHVHIGAGCTLTRTKVGAFTTISPGVDIAGDVTIGEECLIGVGATISNLVTIGDRCVIGAGAVVIEDVPSDTTVAGVPAKPLQRREPSCS